MGNHNRLTKDENINQGQGPRLEDFMVSEAPGRGVYIIGSETPTSQLRRGDFVLGDVEIIRATIDDSDTAG